ncbi:hypothetical protein Niako_2394 [Niastella koreensis GR20-10]|uniref:Uncharacterized protein n=1 Tax=Niastella koreensis (strain DSM 17620 / KACC 11465 / NBRC 106392 / GR20-10) TaxID=700598 RepID=G8TLX8_NIAKG|nr:DUF6520 family protein [Niastella koreensis]AEV98738.1 hypothetical protein Niako_2394 [Niastella koreensis GR20-10]
MKSLKLMLTALTIVAAVGGALAFKATKSSFIFCSTTSTSGANCVLQENKSYTPDSEGPSFCTTDGAPTRQCTTQSNITTLQ